MPETSNLPNRKDFPGIDESRSLRFRYLAQLFYGRRGPSRVATRPVRVLRSIVERSDSECLALKSQKLIANVWCVVAECTNRAK